MILYCLTHNYSSIDTDDPWYNAVDEFDPECIVVTSRPPELPENWIDYVQEPSPEELAEMDACAEQLVYDLTGSLG